MVKDALIRHPRLRHTFVYSNKTLQDIIFRQALADLRRAHPDRLRVIHTLTREQGPATGDEDIRNGRVTLEMLREVFDHEPHSLIYACGPAISVWDRRAHAAAGTTPAPRFLETMTSHWPRSASAVTKSKWKRSADDVAAAEGLSHHRLGVEAAVRGANMPMSIALAIA